jgi:NMD protein affecting ribosome stability and mRNA decay
MKSCSNCGKNHKNRKDNLCNDCRVTPTYPLCKCGLHHVYTGNSCRTCFKIGLPKEYLFKH